MLILFVGVGVVLSHHNDFKENMKLYQRYVDSYLTKEDVIPDHAKTYPGLRRGQIDKAIIHETQY